MAEQTDWELLARFVAGEASAAEATRVERWAAESAQHRALLDQSRQRWELASDPRPHDVDGAWHRLASRISNQPVRGRDSGVLDFPAPGRQWSIAARVLSLAAVLLLAVGIGLVWRKGVEPSPGSLGTSGISRGVISTSVGERRTIDLADGSQVVLSAASQLRVGDGLGSGQRDVYLEGRALFHVQHDARRPFTVHAAGTVSRDLGTDFEVRAYPGDSIVRVIVRDGAVAVRSSERAADSVVLRNNDIAFVGDQRPPSVVHVESVASYLSWTNGEIVFHDTPLSDVAAELSRWYGVQVRFADASLGRLHLSAPFTTSQAIDDVVSVIAKSLQLRVTRDGNVVTFSKTEKGKAEGSGPRAEGGDPQAVR